MAQGLVIETQRRHTVVRLSDEREVSCISKGRLLQLACGDRVSVTVINEFDGVIESITERTSLFYRADAFKEKLVAANVTQVACIVAPDRKSTRLNSSHPRLSRMPSSA